MKPLIDVNTLHKTFLYCLFRQEEITNGMPEEAVLVDGIINRFGFHPNRLKESKSVIKKMLYNLPKSFREGGDLFLHACLDKNGIQWGEHNSMEQLFSLGIGLGLVKSYSNKEFCKFLPGGMPIYELL